MSHIHILFTKLVRQYSRDTLQHREHETRKQLHERFAQSLRALSVVHTTYTHCAIIVIILTLDILHSLVTPLFTSLFSQCLLL